MTDKVDKKVIESLMEKIQEHGYKDYTCRDFERDLLVKRRNALNCTDWSG